MNEKRIKSLVEILKTTIRELEDETKSDPDLYLSATSTADVDYSEILNYFNSNDDDGEY